MTLVNEFITKIPSLEQAQVAGRRIAVTSPPPVSAPPSRSQCLKILGLNDNAQTTEIEAAYRRLVADVTPSQNADHSRVDFARKLLAEIHQAYNYLIVR